MKKALKLLLVIFAFFLFFSCNNNQETPRDTFSVNETNSAQPDELAEARKIYMEKCVKCHKEDGTGGKTMIDGIQIRVPNFRSEKMKKEPDSDFIKAIKNGIPDEGMPSFKDELNEEQIKQLVNFIRKEFQQ